MNIYYDNNVCLSTDKAARSFYIPWECTINDLVTHGHRGTLERAERRKDRANKLHSDGEIYLINY